MSAREARIPLQGVVDPQAGAGDSFASEGEDERTRVWRRNEKLVYIGNFSHMVMYTMCLGGIFDVFLYHLSQHTIDAPDLLTIGDGGLRSSDLRLDTFSSFEMTFNIKPSSVKANNTSCLADNPSLTTDKLTSMCGPSIIHVTDGAGNGDCCKEGNRIPALFFDSGTTRLHLEMDIKGQDADRISEHSMQTCVAEEELEPGKWHHIKVKVAGKSMSKGQGSPDDDGGSVQLFVDGIIVCEVTGTESHDLPERTQAHVFFGSLGGAWKESDPHMPANVQIESFKYGKPASNLFVGVINSMQGFISLLLLYPIGWLGDFLNRYQILRINVFVGAGAAGFLFFAVFLQNIYFLVVGIVIFTFYQQIISSIINAVLADNVVQPRRTQAGSNYKTFSALAMATAPAIQGLVAQFGPAQDDFTKSIFDILLLPGWLALPFVAFAMFAMVPVGSKIGTIQNTDEASQTTHRRRNRNNLSEDWLNETVAFGHRRRFLVALFVNIFFIATMLANGMTVRYFSLYFTNVHHFTPAGLCCLNAICRFFIAGVAQLGKPLAELCGRCNLAILLHVGSAIFTLGIYGGPGSFEPNIYVACGSYMMRFACLHTRDPILYSLTMDTAPPEQRARWASLNSLRSLSFSASAVLGGYLADRYGYEFSFTITVYTLLASTVLIFPAWWVFPKNEGPRPTADATAAPGDAPDSPAKLDKVAETSNTSAHSLALHNHTTGESYTSTTLKETAISVA